MLPLVVKVPWLSIHELRQLQSDHFMNIHTSWCRQDLESGSLQHTSLWWVRFRDRVPPEIWSNVGYSYSNCGKKLFTRLTENKKYSMRRAAKNGYVSMPPPVATVRTVVRCVYCLQTLIQGEDRASVGRLKVQPFCPGRLRPGSAAWRGHSGNQRSRPSAWCDILGWSYSR